MSYELSFDKVPTGRMHQVNLGGVIQNQPIAMPDNPDGTPGEPEYEYILSAIVDGHSVPLEHYTAGYVEHMAGRADTAVDQGQGSTSDQPAAPTAPSPAAGEGTAGEGAAAEQPAAQPAG